MKWKKKTPRHISHTHAYKTTNYLSLSYEDYVARLIRTYTQDNRGDEEKKEEQEVREKNAKVESKVNSMHKHKSIICTMSCKTWLHTDADVHACACKCIYHNLH